ncbi:MAG: RNA polymerase-associated protein RapA [Gammaproteobacteria bacterium]|nr:RNA polymerase-associated protein RapA [Gammaproteobacteria bacterium]
MQVFVRGQRWISDTETELGLGTVLKVDGRLVTILYPASGETRVYSMHNAPLSRVRFAPGDEIEHHDGWLMTVAEVIEAEGLLSYKGLRDETEPAEVPEAGLSNLTQLNKPQDRLFTGQVDSSAWFKLRHDTLKKSQMLAASPYRGLLGARVSLVPHQLHIAKEVASRYAPRVLLADEVGLGKTIEAGMILHAQLESGRARRVLIVVPESLQYQWLMEMRRRFNLRFAMIDEDAVLDTESSTNPFGDEPLTLCSLELLAMQPRAQKLALACEWDLLVVDEAHHLAWDPEEPSVEYRAIELLASDIKGVLLLTATPEQLGVAGHFARLRLLDPARFHDLYAFIDEESRYEEVAESVQELLDGGELSAAAQAKLGELIQGDEAAQAQLALLTGEAEKDEKTAARQGLVRALLDRHGTGRVLFRNTRAAMTGFPERDVHAHALPWPKEYALGEKASGRLYPEASYAGLAPWWFFDPRVHWLCNTLKELKQEKVLIICHRAETALELEEALRTREGILSAVFHEGLSIFERDRAAAFFADSESGAKVLICSEIGSEGRNFQFARHMVLFDLPMHPDLLEQRIGRLDRIGQRHTIHIHVPYFETGGQEALFRWYHEGLNAFASICPAGATLYDELLNELKLAIVKEGHDLDALMVHTRQLAEEHNAALERGRDRLLEINSAGHDDGPETIHAIETLDRDPELPEYMERLFGLIGIDVEDHSDYSYVIRPGDHMQVPSFPELDEDGVTVTYSRSRALAREDQQFLSWEHPMVTGARDLVLSQATGNAAVAMLKNPAVKPGTVLVETLHIVECIAPPELGADRFLPKTLIRNLLDPVGNDLSPKVGINGLSKQLTELDKSVSGKLVRAAQDSLRASLAKSDALAKEKMVGIVAEAEGKMREVLDGERHRLAALKAVNPNVRQDELDFLAECRDELAGYIGNARLRLDAIRIIIAS